MVGLFDMVGLDIRYFPDISRILAKGIAAIFTLIRPLEMFLPRILLWNTHGVEIEDIFIRLSEPENYFVSP